MKRRAEDSTAHYTTPHHTTPEEKKMVRIIIFSSVSLPKKTITKTITKTIITTITTITTHPFYLLGPKEGERGFDPKGPFPPPKIKFGEDVLEEMKNGISVSVVAYTEIDNGGNFTVFLTGFGGLDFAEWSLVTLIDSEFTDLDFSDVKNFLVIVVVFDFELISFNFCIISFPFRKCSLSLSDDDSCQIVIFNSNVNKRNFKDNNKWIRKKKVVEQNNHHKSIWLLSY